MYIDKEYFLKLDKKKHNEIFKLVKLVKVLLSFQSFEQIIELKNG
jgi:hypothetical protein